MPELNRQGLSEEFDLDKVENRSSDIVLFKEGEDPDEIIRNNIDRANRILDQVEEELFNGNFSARLVETAALTMNSITNAVSQIQSTVYNNDYLQLRQRMVELKESELDYKVKNLKKPSIVGSQNIIFTDRESVLKALNKKGNANSVVKGE